MSSHITPNSPTWMSSRSPRDTHLIYENGFLPSLVLHSLWWPLLPLSAVLLFLHKRILLLCLAANLLSIGPQETTLHRSGKVIRLTALVLTGWHPLYSLETLKTRFNVSSEYQGCHPDDLFISMWMVLLDTALKTEFSWCQLCLHWWQHRLSL